MHFLKTLARRLFPVTAALLLALPLPVLAQPVALEEGNQFLRLPNIRSLIWVHWVEIIV